MMKHKSIMSQVVCPLCQVVPQKIILNRLDMFHCSECQLKWLQKCAIKASYYRDKDIDLSKDKLASRKRNVQNRIRTLEKFISLNNLCDIGAGEGLFLEELKKKGYLNLVGVEPNQLANQYSRSKGLEIVQGEIEGVPELYKKRGFSVMTLFHVIEHVEDPKGVLEILYQSLKDGDYLVLETPDFDAYSIKKVNYEHKLVYPEHLFYFNAKNLKDLVLKIGFKVVQVGKRDFDHHNLSIRESLFRLGLWKKKRTSKKERICEGPPAKYLKFGALRGLLRKFLNCLVFGVGRLEYQWMILKR